MPHRLLRHCLAILCASACLSANAATGSSSGNGADHPAGPPPEAIAACKGKTEGAEVSFTGRNGENFTGTCQSINGTLAAAPKGGRPGNPPPVPR